MEEAPQIVCPAGDAVGLTRSGRASRCRIAHETITEIENPRSLAIFCMGKYTDCPTWRRAREEEWARREREFQKEIKRVKPSRNEA